MYRNHHNGQLSIKDFHVSVGGTLDPDNRWVLFSSLMPWEELEETSALSSAQPLVLQQNLWVRPAEWCKS
jgi:hypothetical protein